jgi:hypothetical protein
MERAPSQPQPPQEIDDELPLGTRYMSGELGTTETTAEDSSKNVDGTIGELSDNLSDTEAQEATGLTPEQQQAREHKILRDQGEAELTLKGSQRFDQTVLEIADAGMQKAEIFANKYEDKKYEMKDRYQQWRVEAHQSKLDRATRLSKTAPTERLRRRFAKKARAEATRLEYAKGIQEQARISHMAKLDEKDNSGKLVNPGERSTRRLERNKELQERINKMIAAEYKFAKKGRDLRNAKREELKGIGDPRAREEMRRSLLEKTSSVGKLEAIGREDYLRKDFISRMAEAYGTGGIFASASRIVNEIGNNAADRGTQGEYSLVR